MDNVSVRLAIWMSLVVAFALAVFEGRAATAPMDLVFVASDRWHFTTGVEDIQNTISARSGW
jgi:hypothetical protein